MLAAYGVTSATAGVLTGIIPATAHAAEQLEWRSCRKCRTMFFNGYPQKGRCPAGGGHRASEGANYFLPYDIPGTPNDQAPWRFCNKCHAMFYDGYPNKGRCPGGGGHTAAGYVFVLRHDVRPTAASEGRWRFCTGCNALFYDGAGDKGRCATGAAHTAAGYNFVIRFRGNLSDDVVLNPVDR
jgi:hypothetical protein